MRVLIITGLVLFIISCEVKPEPIVYGEDKCTFCTMNIVDKPYGAELITDKGKIYKFDSTECLLNYMKDDEKGTIFEYKLTNTMDKPGELYDATDTFYLISENLPSPMGAYITAFTSKELAENAQKEYGGEVYSFDEIKELDFKMTGHEHHVK